MFIFHACEKMAYISFNIFIQILFLEPVIHYDIYLYFHKRVGINIV